MPSALPIWNTLLVKVLLHKLKNTDLRAIKAWMLSAHWTILRTAAGSCQNKNVVSVFLGSGLLKLHSFRMVLISQGCWKKNFFFPQTSTFQSIEIDLWVMDENSMTCLCALMSYRPLVNTDFCCWLKSLF
jgi:hypothetical protein